MFSCWALHPDLFQLKLPIASMYGIFTYIYHKDQPNLGKYAIHGCHGCGITCVFVPQVFLPHHRHGGLCDAVAKCCQAESCSALAPVSHVDVG